MKKLLLTLLLLFSLGGLAKAGTVTYTVTGGTKVGTTAITYSVNPNDGLKLDATSNGGTQPAYNTNGGDARIYANGTLTVSNDSPMTKIVFNLSAQAAKRHTSVTASSGTIATQATGDKTVTWTNEAGVKEVTFTVGAKAIYGSESTSAGQFCFATFDVTTDEGESTEIKISAFTGEGEDTVIYKPGETNKVDKNTVVNFSITNCEDTEITAKVNGTDKDVTDGEFSETIVATTKVEISAGTADAKVSATYNFAVAEPFTKEGMEWRRVDNVATLTAGEQFIIACFDQQVAMSNQDNGKEYVPAIPVKIDGNILTYSGSVAGDSPLIVELEASEEGNADIPWLLKTVNYDGEQGYLNAISNTSDKLVFDSESKDDLTIDINDGNAVINFNGHTHNILAYFNETDGIADLFSCYTLNEIEDESVNTVPVQLYRLTAQDAEPRVIISAVSGEGDEMITYSPYATYELARGTDVTFAVKNYTGKIEILVGSDDEAEFENGEHTTTINETTDVLIKAGDVEAEYHFKVVPTFKLEDGTEVIYHTVAEALQTIADGYTPSINVKGVIKSISEVSTTNKCATYTIADNLSSDKELTVYHGKWLNGEDFTKEDQIKVGAQVVVCGQVFNYNDNKPEIAQDNYLLYYYEEPLTPEGYAWIRVDDAATLNAGDRLIIANTVDKKAASNEANNNNRRAMDVDIFENILSFNGDESVVPLVSLLGGDKDNWTFQTINYQSTDGYLASGTTGTTNYLKVQASPMTAKISVENNNAVITFNAGNFDRTIVRYNDKNKLFACYNGGQQPVQLYRLTAPEPKFHGGMQVGHNYTEGCEGFRVNFSFNVVNHNTDPVHHYISLLDANNNKIEDIIVKDLTDENQMSAPRRVEDELPSNVTKINGLFEISGEGMKTTKPATIAIGSHIGNQNIINAYRALDSDGIQTGIQEVETEGAEAEYYNLQGMRVSHPVAGQLYIKRQGNRVSKVKF